jgi:signal transduction histidine kinase
LQAKQWSCRQWGLGLSLVRAICRLHGFSVVVVGRQPSGVIEIIRGVFVAT